MEPILSTNHLVKMYRTHADPFYALNGVTLQVRSGEFVAVMGASGSGKSTLLHLLGGLDSPDEGQIVLAGQRVDQMSEAKRAVLRRRHIGFVFQFFNLVGNLSVADNVEIPGLVAGLTPAEARRRRQQLLEDLGIADKAQAIPSQLSGGERQRVALARAFINQPSVLLADEPTGNLDSHNTGEVLKLLRKYHQAGQTIFLVTHDARVASIADRVLTIKDGAIKQETELDSVYDSQESLSRVIELGV